MIRLLKDNILTAIKLNNYIYSSYLLHHFILIPYYHFRRFYSVADNDYYIDSVYLADSQRLYNIKSWLELEDHGHIKHKNIFCHLITQQEKDSIKITTVFASLFLSDIL